MVARETFNYLEHTTRAIFDLVRDFRHECRDRCCRGPVPIVARVVVRRGRERKHFTLGRRRCQRSAQRGVGAVARRRRARQRQRERDANGLWRVHRADFPADLSAPNSDRHAVLGGLGHHWLGKVRPVTQYLGTVARGGVSAKKKKKNAEEQ